MKVKNKCRNREKDYMNKLNKILEYSKILDKIVKKKNYTVFLEKWSLIDY